MKQLMFEAQHQVFWLEFEKNLHKIEQNKSYSAPIIAEFGSQYRTLCHHLALAQSRHYSAGLCHYLQQLVERAHKQLYQNSASLWQQLRHFIRHTLPNTVRQEKMVVILGHLLFYVPLLLCLFLTWLHPEFLDQIAGKETAEQMGEAYSDMAELQKNHQMRPWGQNWLMFGFYVFNNISIGFQSFVGGLVLGLGAAYVAISNGVIIGAVMGYMLNHSAGPTFFSFIGAHGSFELTGIVLSVAGGLKLGYCIIHPGEYSRKDALKFQGKHAAILIGGAFLFLFIAAVIEGFWSPLTIFPLWLKYTVAAVLWISVYAYFILTGRSKVSVTGHESR